MMNSYRRNDFLQTLIELKDGQVVDEKGDVEPDFARFVGLP